MNITILSLSQIPSRLFPTVFAICFLLYFNSACLAQPSVEKEADFVQGRREMVEKDLRGRGIKDARVIEAMTLVPRHLFVPERQRAEAYDDHPLPIGKGQTIS